MTPGEVFEWSCAIMWASVAFTVTTIVLIFAAGKITKLVKKYDSED